MRTLAVAVCVGAAIASLEGQQSDEHLITSAAMGKVRLGMRLDEARRAEPAARFERASDGDGAALVTVVFGAGDELVLWADEDDPDRPIDWSRPIVTITTFSTTFHTRDGIHPGSLVADVVSTLGPVIEIAVSEIESREFVTFERQPAWLTFRLNHTGRFVAGAPRTRQFEPGARILGVEISSRFRENLPSDADRAELGRLERVWNEAHERGDAAALDALWAPELVVTVPGMAPMGKDESLAIWRSGRIRFTRYETWALDFQVFGDTAEVSGIVERERVGDGTRAADDWRFTKTYQRQGGSWRVVEWRAAERAKR
jgi:ketosteroid isomerase-like protein